MSDKTNTRFSPDPATIVRRVAVGKCKRPQGIDAVAIAAKEAHRALLAANWTVSDEAATLPVHEYDRAIPDGDAWKAIYGYNAEARFERVACGAVCYSFPLPKDAMSSREPEYSITSDEEVIEGRTYYEKSDDGFSAVETPDAGALSTYYELSDAGISPAGVVKVDASVVGDRYLDEGANLYVLFSDSNIPPPLVDFLAEYEDGTRFAQKSNTVCATSDQKEKPNERKGVLEISTVEYGEDHRAAAEYCHIVLALADYDKNRDAWVEGGAMLDSDSIAVEFDREVDITFAPVEHQQKVVASLPLNLGYAGQLNDESTAEMHFRQSPGSRTQTAIIYEKNSQSENDPDYYDGTKIVDVVTNSLTEDALAANLVAAMSAGLFNPNSPNEISGTVNLLSSDKYSGMQWLPSVFCTYDGKPRGYGIRKDDNDSWCCTISTFSRSGLASDDTEWNGLKFDSGFVALCDCRIVVLCGFFDEPYYFDKAETDTHTAKRQSMDVLPTHNSVLGLFHGNKPSGFSIIDITAKPERPPVPDGKLAVVACHDVKKDERVDIVNFDRPLRLTTRGPTVATAFAAVFPLGPGGGSYSSFGSSFDTVNNAVKIDLAQLNSPGAYYMKGDLLPGFIDNCNDGSDAMAIKWGHSWKKKGDYVWYGDTAGKDSSWDAEFRGSMNYAFHFRIDVPFPKYTQNAKISYIDPTTLTTQEEEATITIPARTVHYHTVFTCNNNGGTDWSYYPADGIKLDDGTVRFYFAPLNALWFKPNNSSEGMNVVMKYGNTFSGKWNISSGKLNASNGISTREDTFYGHAIYYIEKAEVKSTHVNKEIDFLCRVNLYSRDYPYGDIVEAKKNYVINSLDYAWNSPRLDFYVNFNSSPKNTASNFEGNNTIPSTTTHMFSKDDNRIYFGCFATRQAATQTSTKDTSLSWSETGYENKKNSATFDPGELSLVRLEP